ncbi:MAG: hypothetical protein F4X76_11720 [Chloroflexi bacterium]|nr:hypothetical protein [Chloroflexota bacterium]
MALLFFDSPSGDDPLPPAPATPATVATATPTASASPDASPSPAPTAPTATPPPTETPAATASPESSPSPTPTQEARPTPDPSRTDYPDLVVREVFSRLNQLFVVVANAGNADADGVVEVSIDGGPPHPIDTGKALRPGDFLEYPLEGEYVQRRGQVVVTVRPTASIVERNAGNNVFVGVVTPDAPNDLAVIDITYGGSGPHLIATIRNRSPIPLTGEVTIAIREFSAEDQLLLRETRELDVERGATQAFEFPAITTPPLESVQVIISTDAINDADASNNLLPRRGPR